MPWLSFGEEMNKIKVEYNVMGNIINLFTDMQEFYDFLTQINDLSTDIELSSKRTMDKLEFYKKYEKELNLLDFSKKQSEEMRLLISEFSKVIYLCIFIQRNMDILPAIMKEFKFTRYTICDEENDSN